MNTFRMRQLARQLQETADTLLEMADAVEKIEGKMPNPDRIYDFGWSVRTCNSLYGGGIKTLGDLLQKSEDDLLSLRNFGETSLTEVKSELKALGLRLKD